MYIVGRIKLPKSADVSALYIQCNEGASVNYTESSAKMTLRKGGRVSFNSYFNSFYESFYANYTILNSLYYLLKLEGNFQVSVYREVYGSNNRELISTDKFESCQSSEGVKVRLPKLSDNNNTGRIYLEITCLSESGLFTEGLLVTKQEKLREVSLGIISCTFKKEAYITKTVNTILEDDLLQKKDFKIFIVDNGQTLNANDFLDKNVELIPNKNVGGSGGFTRGLVAALGENIYSHFLFMDDDIELDSECIYRLFSLYEYANSDFAVSGSMLDLYKKHLLYEAGALYSKNSDDREFGPFSLAPLKHNLDLTNYNSLNSLLVEEETDYGAFWFFSFSKDMVAKIGLPMPYFIKIDDIEFGLRITKRLGGKIVVFPSLAVWHEPFYAKFPVWDTYYYFRNHLITHTLHSSLGHIGAIKYITKGLILCLLLFDYKTPEMILKGFEDYVKGPDFLKKAAPEVLHSEIVQMSKTLSKKYDSQKIQQNYLPSSTQVYQNIRPGKLKKLVSLLTLNGHFLPKFLTSDDDAFILHAKGYTGQRSKALAKKRVLIFEEESACLFQNEINKSAGMKIVKNWLKLVAISSMKSPFLRTAWKNAASEMTSAKFWQQYLGIEKEEKVQSVKQNAEVITEA